MSSSRCSTIGPRTPSGCRPRGRRRRLTADGVDGNERLTVLTGVVLIVLTAAIGVTIIWIGQLMWLHLFLGLALIGPVALKLASTGYRFVRYYTYDPAYRRKGPPIPALRVLAPLVVFLTAVLLGTGGSAAVRRPRFRAARGSAQDLLLRLDHVHGDPRARPSARDPAGAVDLDGLTPPDHGVANRWTGGRATERGDRRSARGWPRACRRATDLTARGPGARDGADRAVLNLDALSCPGCARVEAQRTADGPRRRSRRPQSASAAGRRRVSAGHLEHGRLLLSRGSSPDHEFPLS
jgi:hypothetical protein